MPEILTYTGVYMDPTDPAPAQLHIADIAHALSLLCRGNGQLHGFYSVAQHCLSCAAEAAARGYSRDVQLACLLHDASEAYLSDITRPVKAQLPAYRAYEHTLQTMLYRRFLGREPDMAELALVKEIDDAMLYWEFIALMSVPLQPQAPAIVSAPSYAFRPFDEVEAEFLAVFASLCSDFRD